MNQEEINKILLDVYKLEDKINLSDKDIKMLAEAFKNPEMFVLLRKTLLLLTQDDRGISAYGEYGLIEAEDYEKLGREVAIQKSVDERIRKGIAVFYANVRDLHVEAKKKELELEQKEAKERKDLEEKEEEERELEKVGVGVNI